MESMAVGQCIHAGLSRLSTSKGIGRRDSLSSSRTRDSGYNSDLDALSPLDFPGFKQGRASRAPGPCAMLPDLPEMVGTTSSPQSVFFLEDGTAVQDECIEKWIRENLPSDSRTKERISSIASLSSTRSSDMYTNTDASEDDQEPDNAPMLNVGSLSTRKLVEFILRKVDLSLRQEAYKQCTNQSTSAHRNAANVAPRPSHDTPWQNAGTKRKSRTEGSPPPDEDEDGQHKRRRESAVTMSDESDTIARFACPFYKHDPDRYRNRRTCPGPGWPTVHRMKEHLYRSHAQPIFCPICYATFKSDKEQSYHVRLQQCQRSAPQHIDGIDRETVWTLRKRTTALRLEEDKWRDVYHVLFPEVLLPDIPSPFYDCDSPSESSRRFRRELLRRVQEELFATAAQAPGQVEQQLLQQVAHIIRNCEDDLLRTSAGGPADELHRRASTASTLSMVSNASSSLLSSGHGTPPAPGNSMPAAMCLLPPPPPPPQQQQQQPGIMQTDGLATTLSSTTESCTQTQPSLVPDIDFTPVIWDDQTYSTFSLGIDWNDVFPL